MASYILDLILIGIIVFLVGIAAKRGFVRSSKSILALILTAVMFATLQAPLLNFLEGTKIGDTIKTSVSQNITKTYEKEQLPKDANTTDTETAVFVCSSLGLPEFLSSSIEKTLSGMSQIKNNVMEVITDSISLLIMQVITLILLFLIVRVLVFLLLKILESLFELPVLNILNRGLGIAVGILNSLLVIYIICGAVTLFAPMDTLPGIKETIDATFLLKYFYNNNLLLSLFV